MHTNGGRCTHLEDLLFDFDPRAPLNQDVDLLTAAGVAVADSKTPAGAKAEVADTDVFASEDPAQNPQLKFGFDKTEPRLRPIRSIGDCHHLRLLHGSDYLDWAPTRPGEGHQRAKLARPFA